MSEQFNFSFDINNVSIAAAADGDRVPTFEMLAYAKMLTIDRRDLINDSLGAFNEVSKGYGKMAARNAADLVYSALLANTGNYFHASHGNLLTGAGSQLAYPGLAAAITAFRVQRDAENNNLDLVPSVLVVPPELEEIARQLLTSQGVDTLLQDANAPTTATKVPNGNPLKSAVAMAVEPRLSNDAKWSTASATRWFMFSSPADVPLVFAHLGNDEAPTIEYLGLQAVANKLQVTWRVWQDIGVALADYRAAHRSDGA